MAPRLIRRCAPPGAVLVALLGLAGCSEPAAPEATAPPPAAAARDTTVTPPAPPPVVKELGVPKDFDCGGTVIEVIYLEQAAILQLDGESIRLGQVAAASGVHYQGWRTDGLLVDFRAKGDSAILNVAGNDYPACSPVETPVAAETDAAPGAESPTAAPAPEVVRTYIARGNEPFWQAQANANEVRWSTVDHVAADVFTGVTRTPRADGFDLAATREGGQFALSATDALCNDSMTGMPYPQTVVATVDGREFTGCGGNPIDVLTPNEWTVASIGGAAVSGRPPTLQFGNDGRAGGFAGCNRWSAPVSVGGEGLSLGVAAATLMACVDETASKQESAFLSALGRVTRFDIDPQGDLLLKAGDETVMVAKPSPSPAPEG